MPEGLFPFAVGRHKLIILKRGMDDPSFIGIHRLKGYASLRPLHLIGDILCKIFQGFLPSLTVVFRIHLQFGILPFILSSVYGTLGAIIIGIPVGLLTAVFLSKAATPKLRTVATSAIELLSGIPSVIFGLLGMQLLVPAVAAVFGRASGACLLSAILVLSIMILPSIVSVSVTALNAVPHEYEEGSLALGATEAETWFKVSVPAAKSGIAAGIVLGIGRAVGEAMAVMMVAGNSPNMPGLFKSVTFLTTAIAKEMSYASGLQRQALFSIGLILFIFIMIINLVLNFFLKGGSNGEK